MSSKTIKPLLLTLCLALPPAALGLETAWGPGAQGPGLETLRTFPPGYPAPPEPPLPAPAPDRIVNPCGSSWTVVSANAPAAKTGRAAALPEGINDWSALDGWQEPKSYRVNYYTRNGFGMKAIDFTFRLGYHYGGSLAGRGRYLAEVSLEPEAVSVLPGYRLDAEARVEGFSVVNAGTHEDPVAGMQVKLVMSMASTSNHWTGTVVFYIDGTGKARELAGPDGGRAAGADNFRSLTVKETE